MLVAAAPPILLLAESASWIPSEAVLFGTLIVGLTGLAAAANQIHSLIDRYRGRSAIREIAPQPLEIRGATRYQTTEEADRHAAHMRDRVEHVEQTLDQFRNELAELRGELTSHRQELHTMELRLNQHGEDRAAKLHERINDVLGAVSEVRGQLFPR